jgi:hypothetical protein
MTMEAAMIGPLPPPYTGIHGQAAGSPNATGLN